MARYANVMSIQAEVGDLHETRSDDAGTRSMLAGNVVK